MSAAPAITPQRLAANRANAQLSTGPRTEAGKATSSLNAVKTGLTGRTVLLPAEDAEAYETHLLQYLDAFAPAGARETELVQSLADTQWRLNRIPSLENGIWALGRLRCGALFAEAPELLDTYVLEHEAKQFANLHRQESRLRRYYQQDLKELRALQAERKKQAEEKAKAQQAAVNGFELSTADEPTRNRQKSDQPQHQSAPSIMSACAAPAPNRPQHASADAA